MSSGHCKEDEYRCAYGDKCIPKYYRCDGEWDCTDGSDEQVKCKGKNSGGGTCSVSDEERAFFCGK